MAKKAEVVSISRFRRSDPLAGVPEIQLGHATSEDRTRNATPTPSIDLSGRPKVWFMIGNGSVGKTTYSRWLIWRMVEQGREAQMAALDPGTRALTSWFDNVDQPASRDSGKIEKWLSEYLDYLMADKLAAVLDFGAAGDVPLKGVVDNVSGLHSDMEAAGLGVVACHVLSPRILDLDPLRKMEAAGFQPKATLIVLNEGKVDSNTDPEEAFAAITRHSTYRAAIERGAVPLWLPRLDDDIIAEIELKQLHFGMARDGQVQTVPLFPQLVDCVEARSTAGLNVWKPCTRRSGHGCCSPQIG